MTYIHLIFHKKLNLMIKLQLEKYLMIIMIMMSNIIINYKIIIKRKNDFI